MKTLATLAAALLVVSASHGQVVNNISCTSAEAAAAMRVTSRLGLTPFAPYHWLMYSKSMWFDTEHARDTLGWTPQWSTDAMFAHMSDVTAFIA